MYVILLNMNMFGICSLIWKQGDMGPLGEMGLPGPNGLKVSSETTGVNCCPRVLPLYCLNSPFCYTRKVFLDKFASSVVYLTVFRMFLREVWFCWNLVNPPCAACSRGCLGIQENQDWKVIRWSEYSCYWPVFAQHVMDVFFFLSCCRCLMSQLQHCW